MQALTVDQGQQIPTVPGFRRARFSLVGIVAFATALGACGGDGSNGLGPSTDGGVTGTPDGSVSPGANVFVGERFYVNPSSKASKQVDEWRVTRPEDAEQIEKIASRPVARWFNEWVGDVHTAVTGAVNAAAAQNALPVLVAYNINNRDCGGLSGGGSASPAAYRTWITAFANAISGRKAAVILEPDALANMGCLSQAGQQERVELLAYAIDVLKSKGSVSVYLDAGHPGWHSATEMARRLNLASIARADGFALNVSNFIATATNVTYGQQVSALVGGKHFVIDTSRNGLGSAPGGAWCNPPGRALGQPATAMTANQLVDAYLWVKMPGESDGACNGAPAAGVWWPDYALDIAKRSS